MSSEGVDVPPETSGATRVLHVDDDPSLAKLASRYLERHGEHFDVVTETDARDALERLDGRAFDCVVSDYQMPEMDGLEFLEAVREEYPDLPFILFTGKGSEEIASEAISAGVTDYLQKSDGTDQFAVLATRIDHAVERRQAKDRAESFLRSAPDGIVVVSPDGTITEANPQLHSLFGYDEGELVGEPIERLVPEDQRDAHVDHRDRYMDAPERRPMGADLDLQGRRKDGDLVPVDISLSPMQVGERVEVMAAVRDMTERERLRDRAAQESELIDRIFDISPVGILVFDPENVTVTRLNRRAEQLLPVDAADVDEVEIPLADLDPRDVDGEPLDGAALPIGRVRRTGEAVEDEVVSIATGDGRRWLRVNATPLGDGEVERIVCAFEDVTEQVRHERERRERLDRITDGFLALDDEWTVTYLNEKAATLLERDQEALVGENIWEQFPEAIETTFHDAYVRAMETQEPVDIEEYFEPLDSWFSVQAFPSETGLSVYFQDVTERRARERELREERAILESTIDALPDVFYLFDEDGRFRRWNEQFARVTGYSDDEIAEMEPLDFVPESDADEVADAIARVFDGETAVVESALVTKDGETVPHEFTGALVTVDDETVGLAGIGRDVTEQRERQRRYEAIFNQTFQFTGLLEPDGTLVEANETALAFGGLDRDDVVGEKIWDAYWFQHGDAAEHARAAVEAANEGELYREEIEVQGADRVATIDFSVKPVTDWQGDVDFLVPEGRDITELKERERELRRQNERLDEFASVVSHDLRGPITVAQGNLELLQETCDAEELDDLADAVDRMERLTADLLTLARKGQVVSDTEVVDLEGVAERAWRTVETNEATLEVEPLSLSADSNRLRELLENLFRNAVEHAGPDATVRVGALDDGFYVADDGPGIPPSDRDAVFDSGFTTSEGGTGFGLAIVRSIAEAHDWTVDVEESEAGGARIEIAGVDLERR